MSFLVFQFKIKSHKGTNPMVSCGIKVGHFYDVSEGIIVCSYHNGWYSMYSFMCSIATPFNARNLSLEER